LKGHQVNLQELPLKYPTQLHEAAHWEWLGRTVATFGFLEEVLGKGIFALTGTRTYVGEVALKEAYDQWLPTLEKALTDELGGLIRKFAEAVRAHPDCRIDNFDDLIADLNQARELRNLLCHASWKAPEADGKSLPFFVRRDLRINETKMDEMYLQQVQLGTARLCGVVVSVVTSMGWQFPGSEGPGSPVW
jgi:hypothetical protein